MLTLVQRAQREFAMEIIRGREPLTNILPTTENDARAYLTAVDTMRTHLRHESAERHEATRRDLVASLRTAVSPAVRAELQQQLEQLRVIDNRRAKHRRQQHEARDATDELQTLEAIMMPQLEAEYARRCHHAATA